MDKRINIEGGGASRLVQLMRKHGFNRDMSIEIATVLTPLPNLTVRLPSDGLKLDSDDLVVAEHLTEHTRTINGVSASIGASLSAGDQVIVIGDDDSQLYFVIDKAVM